MFIIVLIKKKSMLEFNLVIKHFNNYKATFSISWAYGISANYSCRSQFNTLSTLTKSFMDYASRRRGQGSLFEGLYRVIMRRNSVYVTFVIAGAFLGERVFF